MSNVVSINASTLSPEQLLRDILSDIEDTKSIVIIRRDYKDVMHSAWSGQTVDQLAPAVVFLMSEVMRMQGDGK